MLAYKVCGISSSFPLFWLSSFWQYIFIMHSYPIQKLLIQLRHTFHWQVTTDCPTNRSFIMWLGTSLLLYGGYMLQHGFSIGIRFVYGLEHTRFSCKTCRIVCFSVENYSMFRQLRLYQHAVDANSGINDNVIQPHCKKLRSDKTTDTHTPTTNARLYVYLKFVLFLGFWIGYLNYKTVTDTPYFEVKSVSCTQTVKAV